MYDQEIAKAFPKGELERKEDVGNYITENNPSKELFHIVKNL